MLDEILANNERFLQNTTLPHIGHAPRKHTAIVTCMDCRLVNMFEDALGLERGDVLELRTAGATISTPDRAGADNAVRPSHSRSNSWQPDRAPVDVSGLVAPPRAVGRGCLIVLFQLAYFGLTNAVDAENSPEPVTWPFAPQPDQLPLIA